MNYLQFDQHLPGGEVEFHRIYIHPVSTFSYVVASPEGDRSVSGNASVMRIVERQSSAFLSFHRWNEPTVMSVPGWWELCTQMRLMPPDKVFYESETPERLKIFKFEKPEGTVRITMTEEQADRLEETVEILVKRKILLREVEEYQSGRCL